MRSTHDQTQIKIVSWNINSDRKVELANHPSFMVTAEAFKTFSLQYRFSLIKASFDYFIKIKKVSLFALQEINDEFLAKLVSYLHEQGLETLTVKYNPTELAFNYVFAYDPLLYRCIHTRQIYLTRSGEAITKREELSNQELLEEQLYCEYEKSSQLVEIKEIKSKKNLIIVNNHFGLSNKHKLLASELLCQRLADINKPLILVGDFNQFDGKSQNIFVEQIETFKKYGFKWESSHLHLQEPKGTFIAFPYDIKRFLNEADCAVYAELELNRNYSDIRQFYIKRIIERNISLIGTALDGVFSKNITEDSQAKFSNCKALLFIEGKRVKPMPCAQSLQEIAQTSYQEGKAIFASDHLAILTKARL